MTIGLLLPSSGRSIFHLTFLSGPHSVGRPVSSEMPLPWGPRKAGQSPDRAALNPAVTTSMQVVKPCNVMVWLLMTVDRGRLNRRHAEQRSSTGRRGHSSTEYTQREMVCGLCGGCAATALI